MKTKLERFELIDGFRGWGALYIATHHCLSDVHSQIPIIESLLHSNDNLLPGFFMLSAFLLCQRIRQESEGNPHWKREFWIRRAFRILPLWWALVLYLKIRHQLDLKIFLSNFFLTYGLYSYDKAYLPVTPSWTLFIEEWFYFFLPLVYPYLVSTVNLLIAILGSVLIAHFWLNYAAHFGVPDSNGYIYRHFLANFQYFICGIGLSQAYFNGTLKQWLMKIREGKNYYLLEILVVISFFVSAAITISTELVCIFYILVVLNSRGVIAKFFNLRIFRWIGVRCYGFYILHECANRGLNLKHLFIQQFGANSGWVNLLWYPVFLCLLLIITELSWRYIERPSQRLGETLIRFLRNRQRQHPLQPQVIGAES